MEFPEGEILLFLPPPTSTEGSGVTSLINQEAARSSAAKTGCRGLIYRPVSGTGLLARRRGSHGFVREPWVSDCGGHLKGFCPV